MSSEASPSPTGSDGAAATASSSAAAPTMQIKIKTLKGEPFSVSLPKDSSVRHLMTLIESSSGAAASSQRLIHKGKVLKADKMIADYALEDGDCLHLIVKSEEQAPASAAAPAAAPSADAAAAPMPVLTPNNAIPPVNPPAFGFGPAPIGAQQQVTFQLPLGGAPGQAIDIGALLSGLMGGLPQQPAAQVQPQQQQQQQQAAPQTPPSGASPPAAAGAGAGAAAGQPNVAAAGSASPAAGVQQVHLHPQSHPALSVNAVRNFLTEVAQNIPRLSAQPPLSMDMRATAVPAAVQTADFPENLAGLVQLLAQTQSVLTGVAPPLLHRMHREVQHLTEPIAANPPANGQADGPAQRLALQAQLRHLAFGLRRVGDSLRGLATLLEAVQVNPQSGEASLLILPAHLQPGRQVAQAQVPVMQMVPNQIHVQGPNGQQILLNVAHGQPVPGQVQVGQFAMQQQSPAAPQQAAGQAAPAPAPAAAPAPVSVPAAGPAAVPESAPAPVAAPAPAGAPVNPLMSLMQQFAGAAGAPAAGGAAGQPAGFNLQHILQQAAPLVGPLMQNLNLSGAPSGAGAEGQPQAPNPMAGIMQALGPMFAGLQAQPPQQQQQAAAAQQPPAAAAPAADAAPAPAPAPAAPVAVPAAAPAAPAGGAGGNAAAPNFGNMLSSLMPMLMNAGNAAGGAAGGSLQDMMQSLLGGAGAGNGAGVAGAASPANRAAGNGARSPDALDEGEGEGEGAEEGEEAASLVDMLISQVMQHLSLPDLMALVQGNWAGMERLHGPLREMLFDLLQDDDAPANRSLLATSFATGIVESALEERAMASVAAQRIPNGPDPARVSYPVVLKHVRALIDLVIDLPVTPVPPPPQPLPAPTADSFSSRLKEWCQAFVGEWLVTLGTCFHDGVTSSQQLATALLQQKLSGVADGSMAFLMPMLSSTVGSVMSRCAQQYQQERLLAGDNASGEAQWLQLLPLEDRARWLRTIEADEQRMQQQLEERNRNEGSAGGEPITTLYRPLSQAYQFGKRKANNAASSSASASSSSAAEEKQ